MLFASLINHLAVQQIREPHGNLISHGKGEEEENSGGKRELLVAGSLYFIPLFSPWEQWSKVCGGGMQGLLFFSFFLGYYLSHQSSFKPGTCLCADIHIVNSVSVILIVSNINMCRVVFTKNRKCNSFI